MVYSASAPSNIALIKYMGKTDFELNIPTNSSLSFSLPHFRTEVRVQKINSSQDKWEPLVLDGFIKPDLSEKGQARFLKYFQKLKNHFGVTDHFLVQSASNFSSDCGLASSASSFAALTKCAALAFTQMGYTAQNDAPLNTLSRQGSGSSCRSFFEPWAIWSGEEAHSIELPFSDMKHEILILSSQKKEVSSGDAHKRVFTSPHFEGRVERAEQRLNQLIDSLIQNKWETAYQIVKDEFEDMHNLFETSVPAFSYRTQQSQDIVSWIDSEWKKLGDGPLVTMDAGPNIHLLFRADQESQAWMKRIQEKFSL